MGRVLVAPLAWGLGHATRDIPLIREFLSRGHRVTFAADGRALDLLRREFPACEAVPFPDYPAPYSASRFFVPRFLAGLPGVFAAIARERRAAAAFLAERRFDLVVSDARYGFWDPETPSCFIAHQLRYCVPAPFTALESVTAAYNAGFHRNFAHVLVPDNPPGPAHLSGRLSVSDHPETRRRARYVGILSSVAKLDVPEDLDFLISISGPEPQRTRLEEILLPQVSRLPGRKIVLLGKPGEDSRVAPDPFTSVRSHATREEMAVLMNRAKFIITRSGYTTMMELAELGKRQALLIPTPGQTEQEHLSAEYERLGWFHSVSQYRLNLAADVACARGFSGFPSMTKTAENVRRLYDDLFAPVLDGGRTLKPFVPASPPSADRVPVAA